ncbi:MAG TPA: Hsp20/alpha crystallin family protein [Candidatus Aenigmarchaeota archaeon]|nr:Hsp20/alpha crystallin family protein [Candidatus Aenigmarchaeota archaeon]
MFWFDPFEEIMKIRREMERVLKNFEDRRFWSTEWRTPLSDVRETDEEVIVTVELPGVSKDDIQLKATEDSLEIRVETKKLIEERGEDFFRKERSYRGFYRRILLPSKVVPEKAKAKYENGILEIRLPKVEAKKKVKEIKIE